ncbi:MAG: glycosyl transferase [Rubritepida sp.]|nr:glycosyl transferase [Rubritepida sp.]
MLVIAAGHPALTGAAQDHAAFRAFAALREDHGSSADFLCGAGTLPPPPGVRIFQPFGPNEFLAETPGFDGTDFTQHDTDLLRRLSLLLRRLEPEVVHLHDLAPFGVELIGLIRREHPATRILLSLGPDLGRRAAITAAPEDTDLTRRFLRATLLKRFLGEMAAILLPCESLRPACLAFGLDPAKLRTHASLPAPTEMTPPPPLGRFLVVAAFPGAVADPAIFATAATLLAGATLPAGRQIRLELHGGWEGQPALERAAALPGSPLALMPDGPRGKALRAAHLALLPAPDGADPEGLSWEALGHRRPVICCPIGSLAERVQPGRDGLHIPMNGPALAELLLNLIEAPDQVAALQQSLLDPPSLAESESALLALYRELASAPVPARI